MIHTVYSHHPPNRVKAQLLNTLNYLGVIGYWRYSYWDYGIEIEI